MAKTGYVWDGTQFVSISSPIAAVPNAVSSYSSSAPASRTTRNNLVTNPSLEVDANSWSSANTIVRSTSYSYVGTASLQTTLLNTGDTNISYTSMGSIVPIGTIVISVYFYIPIGSPLVGQTVSLSIEGGTATTGSPATSNPATLIAGTWVRSSITRTVSVSGTILFVCRTSGLPSANVGANIYTDAALMEIGSNLNPYFDGTNYSSISEAYPSSILTAWTGTANASTSTISYYKQSDVKVGQLWVDSDDRSLYVYNGAEWVIAAAATATIPSINLNSNVIAADYTMAVGYNGTSAGPITVNSGVTVTIPSGSVWTVV
jgi:hypothetical protein